MTTQQSLIRAALDDFESELPRFILADWFEDQGSPRAELIRTQCRLAAWVPDLHERQALLARERELLAEHEDAWLGELKQSCSEWRFQRGLADITMTAWGFARRPFAAVAPELFAQAGVQRVRLEKVGKSMKALAKAPHLEHVTQLDLSRNRLTKKQLDTLLTSPHLQQVTHLDLSNNALTESALQALAAAPLSRLVWLDLRNNQVEGGGLERLLESPFGQRLRWLDLHGNPLGDEMLSCWILWQQERLVPSEDELPRRFLNRAGIPFVLIPAGTFLMGSPSEFAEDPEFSEHYSDEFPQHEVEITKPFYMSVYTITEAEYLRVNGAAPAGERRPHNHPVSEVSWDDVQVFCATLSGLPEEKAAGLVYRIPTEAEWEHACRAGTTTAFHWGDAASSDQANIDGTRPYGGAKRGVHLNHTVPIGSYPPNGFGLHDMHGNIGVWTADWYSKTYYQRCPRKNPCSKRRRADRAMRGGSYLNPPKVCRAARRYCGPPDRRYDMVGMRLACTLAKRRRSTPSTPKSR